MMADEFNFLRPEIKNYKAEADADLIPSPGQLELYGRCRRGVLLSSCFCALFVADLIAGMEELELHYRRRGRSNLRQLEIATISVRMVSEGGVLHSYLLDSTLCFCIAGPATLSSSGTKRGIRKRGIHEKVKFPQF